jgi:ketosteroid isomerase-like protein
VSASSNLDLVRKGFLAAAGGDPDAAQSYFDSSIEWDMAGVVGWPEKRHYQGGREVAAFLQAWAASWGGTWHFDVEDTRDAGEDTVFVAIREWGTGVDSGVSVNQRRYCAVTIRNRRIVLVRMFSERADALAVVGLTD